MLGQLTDMIVKDTCDLRHIQQISQRFTWAMLPRPCLKVVQGSHYSNNGEKSRVSMNKLGHSHAEQVTCSSVVKSYSYWGFGLLTRCYANTITLEGPLVERAKRFVFDLVSSLSHKPWEFTRRSKFNSKVSRTDDNHENWKMHILRERVMT